MALFCLKTVWYNGLLNLCSILPIVILSIAKNLCPFGIPSLPRRGRPARSAEQSEAGGGGVSRLRESRIPLAAGPLIASPRQPPPTQKGRPSLERRG